MGQFFRYDGNLYPYLPPQGKKRKKVNAVDIKKVGLRIHQRRKELGMTQAQLAEKVGITSRYVSGLESGTYVTNLEKISTIADALQVSILYLLDDNIEYTEDRVVQEEQRLKKLFFSVPKDQLALAEGLITQAARLRILLDDNWKDILENGEYEKFQQSENLAPYDRKRPIVEAYDNRDRTYQSVMKQLNDLLPKSDKEDKKKKLLGR